MLNNFKGFIGYTEEEFKELWEKAIFVVDTNILINFYKYTSKESTNSLLDILKKLKETNKLWIPYHVALEYFFNYEDNMLKQNEGYDLLGKELKKLIEDARKVLSTVKSKHPYIITEKFQFFLANMEQSNNQLQEQLDKEIENLPDSKTIQHDLLKLLDGIIGVAYSQEKINAIEKEGKERYKNKVPPGYSDMNDKDKQDFRTYGEITYQQLYGDLIVWNQIIDRAMNEDDPTPIILITEDRKEDWWEKDGKMIKRPQPQLIQEFINKTQQKFYMYRTESFVRNAMEYLNADVTDEQVQEVANEIENIRKVEELKVNDVEKQEEIDKNIFKIVEYLSDKEKKLYDQMLSTSYNLELDPSTANFRFDKAINWAIRAAIPRMEKKFQELIIYLTSFNKEKGHQAQHIYYSLPKDSNKRVLKLLEEIEKLSL